MNAYADEYDVNPYIMWSLMTVESSFNPDSVSVANARGLLQVIPKTGQLVALRLGYFDFGPADLMDPERSIEFGCYYFAELMTKFHGQELLAFAAYNGGPHHVSRWLQGRGSLPLDLFVETIPFDQAREYTKKVYRHVAMYRAIYRDETELYVGNVLDPDFELNIHF
jgi:soluble lytic murein transglycosylase